MKKFKTIGLSLLVAACAACLSLAFIACSGGEKKAGYGAGEEGFYYYDGADSARYMLSLQSGTYMITAGGETQYSGSYSYNNETGEISFSGETAFTAAVGENALSLDMGDSGYSFKAYKYFDVTYVDGNGSIIANESVLNGQSAEALEIEKDGYWFVGWFEDESNSSEFAFNTSIAGDTTVYGWYIEKNPSATEYEITLDYGDGTYETVSTMNGAVWTLPTDGILGWWVSATNKSGELTYKYETGTAFTSDTTLFAVYEGIGASVTSEGITWVNAGANVSVTVYNEDGTVAVALSSTSSTNASFMPTGFSSLSAGTYTVEVTSGSTTEYLTYVVNGLARVSTSSAEVITNGNGEVFSFAPVDGAAGYVITVSDGTRTLTEDLGPRTYYNFSGWEMTKEGITFTVTAYAEGYVSSVSDDYNYLLALEKVTVDIDGENVVWARVENALEYEVIIMSGDTELERVTTSENSFSLKYYDAGTYTISVQPVTDGYWSEASTYYGYAKSTIAAPVITDITSYSVTWGAVSGAASYVVSVNGAEYKVEEGTTLVFTDTNMPATADIYEISVKAVGTNGNDSSFGDAITATNVRFGSGATYYKNTVTWNYDLAAAEYVVSVNGGKTYTVTSGNSVEVDLTQAGLNEIVVTAYDAEGETVGFAEISVNAYSVTLDGNGANTSKSVVYVAQGDTLDLGTASLDHADFIGWYTQADFTGGMSDSYEGSGAEVLDGSTFTGNRNMYLYAYWSYEWIDVRLVSDMGVFVDENGDEVSSATVKIKYGSKSFTLPMPTPNNEEDNFDGWNTKSDGTGTMYTSQDGASLGTAYSGETTLYAYFLSVLRYQKTTYNGETVYSVTAGSKINMTDNVRVPESYEGYGLVINSGAFTNCAFLKSIDIPDTVLFISTVNDGYRAGTGAFEGCSSLEAVNIYETGYASEPLYFSCDGVLFHKISASADGSLELIYFPYAKTGDTVDTDGTDGTMGTTYNMPSVVTNASEYEDYSVEHAVTTISAQVFRDRKVSEVVIPGSVTAVESQAFYGNTTLTKVTFTDDGAETLVLNDNAFVNCTSLTEVNLPLRYTDFNIEAFSGCTSLAAVNIAEYQGSGEPVYKSENGIVLSGSGTTLVYYPLGLSGTEGEVITSNLTTTNITKIGANAFASNKKITSVTISDSVEEIGESAFESCIGMTTLTFAGVDSSPNLKICSRAFYGCLLLTEVKLPSNLTVMEANAFGGCQDLTAVYFDARATEGTQTLDFATNSFGTNSYVTSLWLGKNVPEIDFIGIFGGDRLAEVIVEEGNLYYYSDDCGAVYNAAKTTILYYPLGRVGEYELLGTTTNINGDVFTNRVGLTVLKIGTSVNTIGSADGVVAEVFSGCTYLEKIVVDSTNSTFGSDKNGILYKKGDDGSLTELLYCPLAVADKNLEIGESVTAVSAEAFYKTTVESVEFKATSSFEFSTADYSTTAGTEDLRSYTFNGSTTLKSITIPECATGIPAYTFYNCTALSVANIPSAVTYIGAYAFSGCTSLTGDLTRSGDNDTSGIELPEGLSEIANYAFYGDSKLAVTIPSSVSSIGDYAFSGCWNDSSINVGIVFASAEDGTEETELSIGQSAFADTYYARSVVIPKRVVSLSRDLFWLYYGAVQGVTFTAEFEEGSTLTEIPMGMFYMSGITTIKIPATVKSIGENAFSESKITSIQFTMQEGETSELEEIGQSSFERADQLTSVVIPASVTKIDKSAFNYAYSLTELTFESGSALESIGDSAFINCQNLKSVVIPAGVETIGTSAFSSCVSLESVSFGTGAEGEEVKLTSIGTSCFNGCKVLKSVTIPASLTTIPASAFSGCTALTSVEFENGSALQSIGDSAFDGCALVSFAFPESSAAVLTLGTGIFNGCSMESLTLSSNIADIGDALKGASVASISVGQNTNYATDSTGQVLCSLDYKTIVYVGGSVTGDIVIPGTVETIGSAAFSSQTGITSVTISSGVKSVGDYAFYGCTGITSLSVESTSTSLGSYSFDGCTGLSSVNLPDGFEAIPEYCFRNCDLSLTSLPESLTSIGQYAFYTTNIQSVTLPNVTSIGQYAFESSTIKYAEIGPYLTTMGDRVFSYCRQLSEVKLGSLPIASTIRTFQYCDVLDHVVIPSGVTALGNYTFYYCKGLTEVTIPDSVTSFGTYVFSYCSSLAEITLPAHLTTLGNYSFDNTIITSIVLPDTVTSLGQYCFRQCYYLESIQLDENLTTVNNYAFWHCEALETLIIPKNVTSFGTYVFRYCYSLTYVYLGDSVTTVPNYTFNECSKLQSIEFGSKITSIGTYAFQNCSSLESITLKNGLTSIGTYAFDGCTSLTSVYLPSSVTSVGSRAFGSCKCGVFIENTINYVTTNWSGWDTGFSGTAYYYKQSEPAFNANGTRYDGNYWYYDEDFDMVAWTFDYVTYTAEDGNYVLYSETADAIACICFVSTETVESGEEGEEPVEITTVTLCMAESCESEGDGYKVTLENGTVYTVVLSETSATITETDA